VTTTIIEIGDGMLDSQARIGTAHATLHDLAGREFNACSRNSRDKLTVSTIAGRWRKLLIQHSLIGVNHLRREVTPG
jgi:hypothetical protein